MSMVLITVLEILEILVIKVSQVRHQEQILESHLKNKKIMLISSTHSRIHLRCNKSKARLKMNLVEIYLETLAGSQPRTPNRTPTSLQT